MEIIAQLFFYITIFLILSTYLIYPLFIYVLSQKNKFKVREENIIPLVSIIISAFNEEKFIVEKIKNTLQLDYPKEKLEILIGSDGSTDKTSELLKKYSTDRIKFFDFKVNRGKTAVQNDLVKNSCGEILIFMDAASMVEPNVVKEMVKKFADDRVGGVGGALYFANTAENITTESQGIYWKYEFFLRKSESDLGQMIGVDGPLYAVRRDLYDFLEPDIISDFITPLLILSKRKKVILDLNAKVIEDPTKRAAQELKTRRRITVRALYSLYKHKELLSLKKYPVLALQILFHKIIRWFVGPLLIVNLISALFLMHSLFFKIYIALSVIFIIFAFIGFIINKYAIKIKLFAVPYYFILVNFAALLGIIDFFRKKTVISWEPIR